MRYVLGDIHGCYDQYKKLLEEIAFSDEDELYILGDAMDRGPEPVRVMQDIMNRPNAIYILGNHDLIFYSFMKRLVVEIAEDNYDTQLDADFLIQYQLWQQDGGAVTVEKFRALSLSEKKDMLAYIEEASTYEILEQGEKQYILLHAGLENFSEDKELGDYGLYELLEERMDYNRRYYQDPNIYLVTGHTPTPLIDGWQKVEVFRGNGHIALDCGCVAGGKLAAFCIETEEIIYVDGI